MISSNRCRKDTVHKILVNNRIIRRNYILVGRTECEFSAIRIISALQVHHLLSSMAIE